MRTGLTDRKKVITGMGSGVTTNQKMAGSLEPEKSAALASETVSPEEIQELEDMAEEIKVAMEEGFPKQDITKDNIGKLYKEVEEWRNKKIDEEVQEEQGYYPTITPDDPLYNPMVDVARKKSIESALTEISFEDMIFKGYSDQEVKIREGFTVTFRTITTQQSLWIEREIANLSEETVQYGRHYLSLKQLACGLIAVNGKPVGPSLSNFSKPSHREDFEKVLEEKFEFITKLPQVITDDLIVQFVWFTGRVRKCLSGDVGKKLGN